MYKSFEDYANEIDLTQVLEQFGYQIDKKKSAKNVNYGWLVFDKKDGSGNTSESLLVKKNAKGQFFYLNPNDKRDAGNIISFLCSRNSWDIKNNAKDINEYLSKFQGTYVPNKPTIAVKEPTQEERNATVARYYELTPLTDFSYLKSRAISPKVATSPLFAERIFHNKIEKEINERNVTFVNTVFPMVTEDGQIVGLEIKNLGFTGNAPDSNKASSLWVSNFDKTKPLDQVIIGESAVDMISHYQINEEKLSGKNILYVSSGGNLAEGQIRLLDQMVHSLNPKQIVLANDNDPAGMRYNINISGSLIKSGVSYSINKEGQYNNRLTVNFGKDSFEKVSSLVKDFKDYAVSKTENKIDFIVPNNPDSLNHVQATLSKLHKNLVIDRPITKDFNDDLKQMKVKEKARSIGL